MANYGKGYNNPAYSNHFDSSLFEYEYVREIDPDSPDRNSNYSPPKKMVPYNNQIRLNNSDEYNNSDESNGSVVIEESNNRRVTMICEKRAVMQVEGGGYAHDISWESNPDEENNELGFIPINTGNRTRGSRRETTKINSGYKELETEPWKFKKSQHRYEELEVPKLNNERENMKRSQHRYAEIPDDFEVNGVIFSKKKPRAPSPINYLTSGQSTPSSSALSVPSSPQSNFFEANISRQYHYNSISPIMFPNNLEMADFSPPKPTQFRRESPIGASTITHDPESSYRSKISGKPTIKYALNNVNHSNSKKNQVPSPLRSLKPSQLTPEVKRQKVRRNISSSFQNECSSPYRATTQSMSKIPSPSPQRKSMQNKRGIMYKSSENFSNIDGIRQSQWNINPMSGRDERIKRNKSVPNFLQSSSPQKRTPLKVQPDNFGQSTPSRTCRVAVTESPLNYSSIGRSQTSLFDDLRDSWSHVTSFTTPYGCLPLAAFIQLGIGLATCGLCFYLFLQLGRRYYLDLGILGGFISVILGVMGFRAQHWRWLPHRNYMTGYFVLTVFTMLTFACLLLILTVRPTVGDPILDVLAGAISTVSVIIIALALTGLTMSGCCKTPPPDNRVTCA